MTEISYFWGGTSPGDAVNAPYDNDEWSDLWRKLFMRDRTIQGVLESYTNGLVVTNPSGNTLRVATGGALVDGKFYENDANVDNSIATPSVSTRIDRVVLRKSWAAQTIRVAVLTGVEGGGVPTITQTDGVTWEIPLAQASITTAPAITLTDEINFARTPLVSSSVSAFISIETIVAGGSDAIIDFLNIPTTYQHLFIIGSGAMGGAVVEADLELRFNNDSGANYNEVNMGGENASALAASAAATNEILVGQIKGASGTADHASQLQINIPNYKDTVFFKTVMGESGHIPNVTLADFAVKINSGIWEDTAAISRITLLSTTGSAGNFVSGSTFSLYGLLS